MATAHLAGGERTLLGGRFKRAREARGLTLAAVSAGTKIPPRHLEALERGEAIGLPEFYQRAEVRAVAREVGVDEQWALSQLQTALAPVEPPAAALHVRATGVRSQYAEAVIGASIAVVLLLGWNAFSRVSSLHRSAPAHQLAAAQLLEPAAAPQVMSAKTAEPAQILDPEFAGAAPAAVPTELVIRTQPEGARVTVDGIGWGVSPLTIRHLEPGDKRIRVTMPGYAAVERSVLIGEGSRQAVSIRLR